MGAREHMHTHTWSADHKEILPPMLLYLKLFNGCGTLKVKKKRRWFQSILLQASTQQTRAELDKEMLFLCMDLKFSRELIYKS